MMQFQGLPSLLGETASLNCVAFLISFSIFLFHLSLKSSPPLAVSPPTPDPPALVALPRSRPSALHSASLPPSVMYMYPHQRQGTGLSAPPALEARRTSAPQLPSLLLPPPLPSLSPWSPQIGQWHVADGLSMDSRLYASNVSDSLFNTTLVVTTILVSGCPLGLPAATLRGASSISRRSQPPREQKMGALITARRPIYDSVIKLKLLFHMEMISDEFQSSWGSRMGWQDSTVCGRLFQGHPDSQGSCAQPRAGHLGHAGEVPQGGSYSFTTACFPWRLLVQVASLAVDT